MKEFNLLLPIAGKGNRFTEEGYTVPKPLIPVDDQKILVEKSLESVNIEKANMIFIVRKEHIDEHQLDQRLKNTFKNNKVTIVSVDYDTEGALSSCMLAEEHLDNEKPLVIFTPDCLFGPAFDVASMEGDVSGAVATFSSSSPAHSYVVLDEDGYVSKAAEKEVISRNAVGGLYYFREGSLFVRYAKEMIDKKDKTKGEYYICPVYNLAVRDGHKIAIDRNAWHYVLGTPEGLEKYQEIIREENDD